MDQLAADLAREAQHLKLDTSNVQECGEEVVRAFARIVLEELAARGLLAASPEAGCWAERRPSGN